MTESQSPIFAYAAAVSKSNKTLHPGEPQDDSRHVLNQDGLLTDHDQLSSAVPSRTPDESRNSIIVFESPLVKLQTGKYMFHDMDRSFIIISDFAVTLKCLLAIFPGLLLVIDVLIINTAITNY